MSNPDPAAILKEHYTNMPEVTRRVATRVLSELQELRRAASVKPDPQTPGEIGEALAALAAKVEGLSEQYESGYSEGYDKGREDAVMEMKAALDRGLSE